MQFRDLPRQHSIPQLCVSRKFDVNSVLPFRKYLEPQKDLVSGSNSGRLSTTLFAWNAYRERLMSTFKSG